MPFPECRPPKDSRLLSDLDDDLAFGSRCLDISQRLVALGVYSTLIGALQLAGAMEGTKLSGRILAAGKAAARAPIEPPFKEELAL